MLYQYISCSNIARQGELDEAVAAVMNEGAVCQVLSMSGSEWAPLEWERWPACNWLVVPQSTPVSGSTDCVATNVTFLVPSQFVLLFYFMLSYPS